MKRKEVKVYRYGAGKAETGQTSGIVRQELVSADDSWVGFAETEASNTSAWHHHSEYNTYVYVISGEIKLEFGKGGKQSCTAKAGEVAHIPSNFIHRESNPSKKKQKLFVVRVGQGIPVVNADKP